ncbi:MAG: hypothetical protein ABIJ48_10765 [Actinomycetota bacterium]
MDGPRQPGPGPTRARVSPEPITASAPAARVAEPAAGVTCLFLGTVRDQSPGRESVTHLE